MGISSTQERYVNFYTDFAFKKLFGTEVNKELLISFLNSLFEGKEVIKDLKYLNVEHLGHAAAEHKAVFDVYCENEQGEKFLIEMQKAEKNSHVTPYSYCNGDPVNRVDPDGRTPIYNTNGELIGITDNGLQGEAIIMEQSNYHDKITLDEAMKFQLGEEGLVGSDAQNRFRDSFNNLSKRPDWDGYITLSEANEWYRNGNGETLYADLNKIDLSGIVSLGKNYVGQTKTFNLLFYSDNLNDGLVYGNITLKRYPNNSVRAYADIYDFDMKSWYNPLNWGRNIETIIGKNYAAQGTSYTIYIYGTKKLTPILPWIK